MKLVRFHTTAFSMAALASVAGAACGTTAASQSPPQPTRGVYTLTGGVLNAGNPEMVEDPTESVVAESSSSGIFVQTVDATTGALTGAGSARGGYTGLAIDRTSHFLYGTVFSFPGWAVSTFSLTTSTGAISQLSTVRLQ
jgi:hypothetical protein